MSRSAFIGLLIIAGILIASAALFSRGGVSPQSLAPLAVGEPLLPDVSNQLNAIETVKITDSEATLTLVRNAAGWGFSGWPGLPADTGKVRRLLLSLAEIKVSDIKTNDPNLFDMVGLGEDALTLNIAPVGILHIGKSAGRGGRFVRLASSDQSYAAGPIALPTTSIKDWAGFELPTVKSQDVYAVSVQPFEGPDYDLLREEGGFELYDLTEDEALAYEGVTDALASAAAYLTFESLRPASELSWADAAQTRFNGQEAGSYMLYELVKDGETYWIRATPAGNFRSDEDDLNWADWAFEISQYRAEELSKARTELLAKDDG